MILYSLIVHYWNKDLGYAFPSIGTLALDYGKSEKTTRTHLKDLERFGLLKVKRTRGEKNLYLPLVPLDRETLFSRYPEAKKKYEKQQNEIDKECKRSLANLEAWKQGKEEAPRQKNKVYQVSPNPELNEYIARHFYELNVPTTNETERELLWVEFINNMEKKSARNSGLAFLQRFLKDQIETLFFEMDPEEMSNYLREKYALSIGIELEMEMSLEQFIANHIKFNILGSE
jgi:hypothetical protein